MVLTPSNMLPIGTSAPDFVLPDTVSGADMALADIAGESGTLVMFICNHCPYVIHIREELVRLADAYMPRGIGCVAISSNDVSDYPEDGPDKMRQLAQTIGMGFPYLFDSEQVVAKAYQAACTPDFFLFDADGELVYRGRLDGSTPGNGVPITGGDLRGAMEALLSGQRVPEEEQMPSMGCNIKWAA